MNDIVGGAKDAREKEGLPLFERRKIAYQSRGVLKWDRNGLLTCEGQNPLQCVVQTGERYCRWDVNVEDPKAEILLCKIKARYPRFVEKRLLTC